MTPAADAMLAWVPHPKWVPIDDDAEHDLDASE